MPTDIQQALKRHKFCLEAERKQRLREKEDLQFQTPEGQWTKEAKEGRAGTTIAGVVIPPRPMLSIPTLDEPIQLLANQARAAHLGVNIHPLSEDATDDTAEVLQGLYRHIETDSRAGIARHWAYDRVLWCGTGAYRVDKVYDPDGGHPLDQKLIFRRIVYQASAHFDPFAQEPDKSDGEYGFIDSDMRWTTFKRKYPKSKFKDYSDGEFTSLMDEQPGWIGGDSEESRTIRVSEYFRLEIETRTLVLLDDNSTAYKDEIPNGRSAMTGDAARSREIETRRVWWATINCVEELEPAQEWDGIYIPMIYCLGRELQPFENDGDRRTIGMVHNAKDSARLVNWGASGVVEMAATEPKAPWLLEEGVDEGHEIEFQQSNIRNLPSIHYKRTGLNGQQANKPERMQVDVSRMGPNLQLLSLGKDFVQTATSTFDPALGKQPTAHRSGRAIVALQDQTVESTSHYLDNLANVSMMYEARVVLDLIPRIYDRPGRIVRILDENNKASSVMLNQPFTVNPNTQRPEASTAPVDPADTRNAVKHYDLNKGRYGVSVTIGKTSASRLLAGQDAIGQVLQAAPELMPIIGPEWMKFQDFPGAKGIATILEKMRANQFPFLADNAQADAAQKLALAESTMKEMHAALEDLQKQIDADTVKTQGQVEIKKAEFQRDLQLQTMKDATQIAVAKISAMTKGVIADKEAEDEAIALNQQHAHEAATADADHSATMTQADQAHGHALEQSDQSHQQAVVQGEQAQSHGLETQAAQPPEPAAQE